jgi:uncharacterized protein DUF6174
MKRSSFVIGVMLLGGCDFTSESLRKEQEWKAQEIHDYSFVYTRLCFCGFDGPNPAVITVHNDVVTKVVNPISSVSGGVSTVGYPTIDAVFAIIANAKSHGADEIDVRYDNTYAFPKSIKIDYERHAVDDEVEYRIENFTVLSAGQE